MKITKFIWFFGLVAFSYGLDKNYIPQNYLFEIQSDIVVVNDDSKKNNASLLNCNLIFELPYTSKTEKLFLFQASGHLKYNNDYEANAGFIYKTSKTKDCFGANVFIDAIFDASYDFTVSAGLGVENLFLKGLVFNAYIPFYSTKKYVKKDDIIAACDLSVSLPLNLFTKMTSFKVSGLFALQSSYDANFAIRLDAVNSINEDLIKVELVPYFKIENFKDISIGVNVSGAFASAAKPSSTALTLRRIARNTSVLYSARELKVKQLQSLSKDQQGYTSGSAVLKDNNPADLKDEKFYVVAAEASSPSLKQNPAVSHILKTDDKDSVVSGASLSSLEIDEEDGATTSSLKQSDEPSFPATNKENPPVGLFDDLSTVSAADDSITSHSSAIKAPKEREGSFDLSDSEPESAQDVLETTGPLPPSPESDTDSLEGDLPPEFNGADAEAIAPTPMAAASPKGESESTQKALLVREDAEANVLETTAPLPPSPESDTDSLEGDLPPVFNGADAEAIAPTPFAAATPKGESESTQKALLVREDAEANVHENTGPLPPSPESDTDSLVGDLPPVFNGAGAVEDAVTASTALAAASSDTEDAKPQTSVSSEDSLVGAFDNIDAEPTLPDVQRKDLAQAILHAPTVVSVTGVDETGQSQVSEGELGIIHPSLYYSSSTVSLMNNSAGIVGIMDTAK